MMISPQYEAFFGTTEKVGKGSVQTLFYHFLGLPIFPQTSYWVEGGPFTRLESTKVLELGRSWPSIVGGYLRGWTTMCAIYALAAGVALFFVPPMGAFPGDPMPMGHTILAPALAALGVGGLFVAAVVWFLTRRPLVGDEAAKRAVFQSFTGLPVDAALLTADVSTKLQLQGLLNDLVQAGYESGLGKHEELKARWYDAAVDPRMQRPDVLRLALTVARSQQGMTKDAQKRAQYADVEARIWQSLCGLDPSVRALQPVGPT